MDIALFELALEKEKKYCRTPVFSFIRFMAAGLFVGLEKAFFRIGSC